MVMILRNIEPFYKTGMNVKDPDTMIINIEVHYTSKTFTNDRYLVSFIVSGMNLLVLNRP